MKHPELTGRAAAAKILLMQDHGKGRRRAGRRGFAAAVLMGGAMMVAGCISVNAPDRPIVIELNINIKHELILQLAQDAEKTMNEHKDIF